MQVSGGALITKSCLSECWMVCLCDSVHEAVRPSLSNKKSPKIITDLKNFDKLRYIFIKVGIKYFYGNNFLKRALDHNEPNALSIFFMFNYPL